MINTKSGLSLDGGLQCETTTTSRVDRTTKYLWRLSNGLLIESVYIERETFFGLCLSTQVGCNMGCSFCATARQKTEYDLSSSEILDQARYCIDKSATSLPLQFVTLAGMGEPLANYANCMNGLSQIEDAFHPTTLSLSTVGLVPKIHRMCREKRRFRLYVSLHASNDYVRRKIVPIGARWSINETLEALSRYGEINAPGDAQISYLLLKGINDSDNDLRALIELVKGRPLFVQILLWNSVEGANYARTDDRTAEKWVGELISRGVLAYASPSRGGDIRAACGQLATLRTAFQATGS